MSIQYFIGRFCQKGVVKSKGSYKGGPYKGFPMVLVHYGLSTADNPLRQNHSHYVLK